MSTFLNISTDTTLGGNSPSDFAVSSQKAIKTYVDAHSGGGGSTYTAGDGIDITNNVISVDGETVSEVTLATVATSGSYNDLSNKPTIPTVNNATLTITQGGTTKGTFTANASSNVTIDLDSGGGSSRNIGEVVQSTIPLTDAGLHLLDGSVIQRGSYADFVDYIAGLVSTYPDIFTTEANWQTAVTTYGVCGKFVYDSTNQTVRLPKYNSKFYSGGGIANAKGNGMNLGLTDGTKLTGLTVTSVAGDNRTLYNKGTAYGVNSPAITGGTGTNITSDKGIGVTTDPAKSGIIADLSTITTALDGYWYIVIATSTKTDIEVDIDEIATDLNGKVSIQDLSTIHCVVETYQNGNDWYRIYDDGWCEQGGYVASNGTVTLLKAFSNTEYNLTFGATGGASGVPRATKSASSFLYSSANQSNQPADWLACGYTEV